MRCVLCFKCLGEVVLSFVFICRWSCFALIFICLCGFIRDRLDFCWRCLSFRCLHFRFVFYRDFPEEESPKWHSLETEKYRLSVAELVIRKEYVSGNKQIYCLAREKWAFPNAQISKTKLNPRPSFTFSSSEIFFDFPPAWVGWGLRLQQRCKVCCDVKKGAKGKTHSCKGIWFYHSSFMSSKCPIKTDCHFSRKSFSLQEVGPRISQYTLQEEKSRSSEFCQTHFPSVREVNTFTG